VERNRNYQRRRFVINQFVDGVRQHPAQRSREWRDVLVFQQVDETAKSAFVLAEGESTIEVRRRVAATGTESSAHQQGCAAETVAAYDALRCARGLECSQALAADRDSGDAIQRCLAELAIRREEDAKNVFEEL
jgi:hypothetical protein